MRRDKREVKLFLMRRFIGGLKCIVFDLKNMVMYEKTV